MTWSQVLQLPCTSTARNFADLLAMASILISELFETCSGGVAGGTMQKIWMSMRRMFLCAMTQEGTGVRGLRHIQDLKSPLRQ